MNLSYIFRIFRPAYQSLRLCSTSHPFAINHVNSFADRTHTCGQLRKSNVGQKVKLCGWVQFRRLNKFLILRDSYGIIQLVVPNEKLDIIEAINKVPLESVIAAEGHVIERPVGLENMKLPTGEIEVVLDNLKILSSSIPKLPFNILDSPKVKDSLRLQYRYLDLRHARMQRNLRLRSDIVMKMREFLVNHHGFVDIETPTLFKRTPGGAQEFVVPTRAPRKFYSLVQSPQQFKQLLMVGGFDRYFQIARCYRDESTKPERQPEFTQVDIEMSFTSKEHIQRLVEGLLYYVWPKDLGTLNLPFPVMSYKEAMSKYGVDKPDTRFGNLLQDVTDIVNTSKMSLLFPVSQSDNCIAVSIVFGNTADAMTKSLGEELTKIVKETYPDVSFIPIRLDQDSKWKTSLAKKIPSETMARISTHLGASANDTILFGFGPARSVVPCMGKMRLETANRLEALGVKTRSDSYNFLWVVDFPLFLPSENQPDRLESTHHPFTAPHPEDADLLYSSPASVRGQHYDLVLNGSEIGGGSIRIHQSEVQQYVLDQILKENSTSLEHLLEALRSGCPPHGGIALGLDRLLSIICRTKTIRDVIAFPKSLDGKDLMSGAPSDITDPERKLYHLSFPHQC